MKIIIFVFLLVVFNSACAQDLADNESFNLKGSVITNKTGLIWLSYSNKAGKDILDSTYLNNGNFQFTGSVNGASRARLRFDNKSRGVDDPNSTSIFIENTKMMIEVKENDFKNAKITGSETQIDNERLEKSKIELSKQQEALNFELKQLNNSINNKDTLFGTWKKLELTNSTYQETLENLKQLDFSFIESHPSSYLSSYLLNSYVTRRKLSIDSTELFFNKLTKQIQNSTFGKLINEQIRNVKSSKVGARAPLFSLIGSQGLQINLEDFREKNYVLLDFWASWCVPCRENTPKIALLYEKYKSMGLEIISISVDTDKKAWLKALDQDKTAWHHILDPIPFQDAGLMAKYAIPSIPLLLLLDQKGVIIGRFENGSLLDLEKQLKLIF